MKKTDTLILTGILTLAVVGGIFGAPPDNAKKEEQTVPLLKYQVDTNNMFQAGINLGLKTVIENHNNLSSFAAMQSTMMSNQVMLGKILISVDRRLEKLEKLLASNTNNASLKSDPLSGKNSGELTLKSLEVSKKSPSEKEKK